MHTSEFFRNKAARCRELARSQALANEAPLRACGLLALALEFEARAAAAEAQVPASRQAEHAA